MRRPRREGRRGNGQGRTPDWQKDGRVAGVGHVSQCVSEEHPCGPAVCAAFPLSLTYGLQSVLIIVLAGIGERVLLNLFLWLAG